MKGGKTMVDKEGVLKHLMPAKRLLELAFIAHCFKMGQYQEHNPRIAYSIPFLHWLLTPDFRKHLRQNGFSFYTNEKVEVRYLVDENPQAPMPGYAPSNCWTFRADKERTDPLVMKLLIEAAIRKDKRGIVFSPKAFGPMASPADQLPHRRFWKAIGSFNKKPKKIISDISENGYIIVSWGRIGFAGIKGLCDLFREFTTMVAANPQTLENIRPTVFDPDPSSMANNKDLYLPEEFHAQLFELWDEQRQALKAQI